MGAPKAQNIIGLSDDRQCVTIRHGWGDSVDGVRSLARTDLIRTAKLAFPATAGNLWISQDNDSIRTAILTGVLPENIGRSASVKAHNGPDNAKALCDAQDEIARLRDQIAELESAPRGEVVKVPQSSDHRHPMFDVVYRLAALGKNVYLVGPAGTGKSTLAAHVADALGRPFYAISCHAQMTGAALSGYMDAQGRYVATDFRHAYVGDTSDAGLFCLDEIDNGNPNILASLNSAIANGHASFADGGKPRHEDFVMVATANTFGTGATAQYVGRNPLDAATKDRFVMVEIDYDTEYERERAGAVGQSDWADRIHAYRGKVAEYGLKLILSTRCIVDGADMLAAGFTVEQVLAMRVFAGVPEDQVRKVREADKTYRKARKVADDTEPEPEAEAVHFDNAAGDLALITVRFDSKCRICGDTVSKGTRAYYYKKQNASERSYVLHVGCK